MAAARLQRSQQRVAVLEQLTTDEESKGSSEQLPNAHAVFAECYELCRTGSFETAIGLLERVQAADAELAFEMKALPGMLLLSSEGSNGYTMLHQAAWHGSELGVRQVLRLGANAAQPNAAGQTAEQIAHERGHASVAGMLQAHVEAWGGWGLVELSALACVYHGHDGARFVDGEAYLTRLVQRDVGKHGQEGPGSLFRRSLPSGLTILSLARRIRTPCAALLVANFGPGDEGSEAPELEIPEAPAPAAAAEVEADEWPEDDWSPPCKDFMCCTLCKGASGALGRWGAGNALPSNHLRYPLLVCAPCQRKVGMLPSGPDSSAAVEASAQRPTAGWVGEATGFETLRLVARPGRWDSSVAQLVHPVLGAVWH